MPSEARFSGSTNIPPSWVTDTIPATVAEGDSVEVELLDKCGDTDGPQALTFTLITVEPRAALEQSTLTFRAGRLDSGVYVLGLVADDGKDTDTASVEVTVAASYHAVSIAAINGTIELVPQAIRYRWGDTVSVSATPADGYVFDGWGGDLHGSNASSEMVVIRDMSVTARFVDESVAQCRELTPGESINATMRQIAQSAEGKGTICLRPGSYDGNTVTVIGYPRVLIR
jgi:hypothetical protein